MVKSSPYVELANDLEINKAITYLRQKDFNQVNVFVQHLLALEEGEPLTFYSNHNILPSN